MRVSYRAVECRRQFFGYADIHLSAIHNTPSIDVTHDANANQDLQQLSDADARGGRARKLAMKDAVDITALSTLYPVLILSVITSGPNGKHCRRKDRTKHPSPLSTLSITLI